MMAVMTYNAYFTIALTIGGCLGYWIFGPTLVQLNMQRFYRKQALVKCDENCKGKMLFHIKSIIYKTVSILICCIIVIISRYLYESIFTNQTRICSLYCCRAISH